VVVLVGLFGGIVTAAAAGARRTDDAYSRFVVANRGAPYMIDDFIPNPEAAVLDPGTLAALPSIAVMALLTVAHLLTTSIRRRRRDLAILKTLGFAHGDVGRTVAWQATTLAVVTLVAAVPLGVAAGRTAWRLFAEQLGVVPDVSTPVALLALEVPASILLANVISIGPAVTAMRTHPASVLREE
jgi:ABC-type lipoprotein release transport system permease subunit